MPEYHSSHSKQDHPLFGVQQTENEISVTSSCHSGGNGDEPGDQAPVLPVCESGMQDRRERKEDKIRRVENKKAGTVAAGKLLLAFHLFQPRASFKAGHRHLSLLQQPGYEQPKLPDEPGRADESQRSELTECALLTLSPVTVLVGRKKGASLTQPKCPFVRLFEAWFELLLFQQHYGSQTP